MATPSDTAGRDPRPISVFFLCNEWNSSKGGLPTFNRELAINLANTSNDKIRVMCYVSKSSEQEREDAKTHKVVLITAKEIPGTCDPLEWLRLPPSELSHLDVVIGHGLKFGIPAYCIARTTKCKWVQFVHVFYEDLGKYKQTVGPDSIEENEEKQKEEIKLCKEANVVVTVGARLQQKYIDRLSDIKVGVITPGILEHFCYLSDKREAKLLHNSVKFGIFVFGRASYEDLTLKGYDIIADAVGSLGEKFKVTFVGAQKGQHRVMEDWFLNNTRITRRQVTIRGYCNQSDFKEMLFEADMVALPSRTEGFGLVALEAISAGVPVLVTSESGIAKALESVEGGKADIIESEDPQEWAQKIRILSEISPEERHNTAICLRESYNKAYSWSAQCEKFEKMIVDLLQPGCHGHHVQCQDSPGLPGQKEQKVILQDSQRKVTEKEEVLNHMYEDLPNEEIPWYFGNLTQSSAEELLQNQSQGKFLVRTLQSTEKLESYVISLRERDGYQHVLIELLPNGHLRLEGYKDHLLPNLVALVRYFVTHWESDFALVPLTKEEVYLKDKQQSKAVATKTGSVPFTSLHSAAKTGDIFVIETLLSKGVEVDSRNSNGSTPLLTAAANDKWNAFKFLMERGSDPTLENNNGWSVLHAAAQGGSLVIVGKLLSLGLNIDSRNSDGSTPLMIAAANGKLNALSFLVERGSDLTLKNQEGRSVLHKAAVGGSNVIIEKLLSLGLDINIRDNYGSTPVIVAAANGKLNAVCFLVERGADLTLENNEGWSVLHGAAQGGNHVMIERLLSFGLDIDFRDSHGASPLMIAAANGKLNAFRFLLEAGADPTLRNHDEWTVLHKAAKGGNGVIIEKLLSLGLDIDSRNNSGSTPLMIAADNGKFQAFSVLIEKGSDPTLKNSNGLSLLHIASQGGNDVIVKKLLSLGYDIASMDNFTFAP